MPLWSSIFRPERVKSDLDAEIASHLALAAADKRDRGLTPEAARQAAEREFGNAALVKDVVRRIWGWIWLESLHQDIKYALRQLRRSRGFSAVVIATLAFGIGAATAIRFYLGLCPMPAPNGLWPLTKRASTASRILIAA
jgi:hypothetical protein